MKPLIVENSPIHTNPVPHCIGTWTLKSYRDLQRRKGEPTKTNRACHGPLRAIRGPGSFGEALLQKMG